MSPLRLLGWSLTALAVSCATIVGVVALMFVAGFVQAVVR